MTSKYSMPLVRLLINGKNPHARLCAPLARALAILYCSPIASLNRFVFRSEDLEVLDALGPVAYQREEPPCPVVRAVGEGSGYLVLLADRLIEPFCVRVTAEHVLEILEGLVVLFSLEEELPGPEQRLRSIHRPRELEGNVLIGLDRGAPAAGILAPPGLVHQGEGGAALRAGKARKGGLLHLPSGLGIPGQFGRQPCGCAQRERRRDPNGEQEAAGKKDRHEDGNHQRIRALP